MHNRKQETESEISAYLRTRVEKEFCGKCLKFHSCNETGWPDRWVLIPGGLVYLVEIKKDERSRIARLQEINGEWLQANGFHYKLINSKKEVDDLIDEIRKKCVLL